MTRRNRYLRLLAATTALVVPLTGCDMGGPPAEANDQVEGQYPPLNEGDTHDVPIELTITNADPRDHLWINSFLQVSLEDFRDLTRTVLTDTGQALAREPDNRGFDVAPALACDDTERPTCTANLVLRIEATTGPITGGRWLMTALLRAEGKGDLPDGATIQVQAAGT